MPQPRPQTSRYKADECHDSKVNNDHNSNAESSAASESRIQPTPNFYPAYCHRASPTWFTWVKLTAWDIHNVLRSRRGMITSANSTGNIGKTVPSNSVYTSSSTPLLLYFLNHPIQYVQVCGVVVSIEAYYETHFLFTLDDSSGCTIDVFYRKPVLPPLPPPSNIPGELIKSTATATATTTPLLLQDLQSLTVGRIVRAKGHISIYHSTHQLVLLRLDIFPSQTATKLESAHITSRANFLTETLIKPWAVSAEDQARLLRDAKGESIDEKDRDRRRKKRAERRLQREEEDRKQIQEEYNAEEEVRSRYAEEARMDGEMLKKGRACQ